MDGYSLQFADFINVTTQQTESLGLIQKEVNQGRAFINIIKQSTNKELEGSSQRVRKSVTFQCYSFVERMINPSTLVMIGNEKYGNLEVTPVFGSKTMIEIVAVL